MSRTKTGILELDEMLRGGFLEGDAVLLAGGAGTGKTTLALQYLVNGITQFGERGVYVTFEQLPAQIYRDAESFGWNLRLMEDENKLRMVCTSPNLLLDTEDEEHLLSETIREIQPRRVVIDSLSHLEMHIDEKELRKELYRLIMLLKSRGQHLAVSEVGTSFLVDCIILLKQVEIESSIRKALAVLKMRGSDHDKRLREYEITPQGINVSAPFTQYEGVLTGTPHRSLIDEAANSWASAFGKNKQKHS